MKHLLRGHAVHFRCQHPEALRMRVDVMAKMRGIEAFPKLWRRRTTLELPDGTVCDLLSLPDLVQAKKTQRDKDWPMIRRLVEAHYFQHHVKPTLAQVRFWLQELRTPEILIELAAARASVCRRMTAKRPLLADAARGDRPAVERALASEEATEREQDRRYWQPLKRELEALRHAQ